METQPEAEDAIGEASASGDANEPSPVECLRSCFGGQSSVKRRMVLRFAADCDLCSLGELLFLDLRTA